MKPSPDAPVPAAPEPLEDSVSHSLGVLAQVYHYNHWIYDSFRTHVAGKILEVGAGVGNITQFLLNHPQVTCLEPSTPFADHLRDRFAEHLNVAVRETRIEDLPDAALPAGSFDSVVCPNVLEHIDDDRAAVRAMARTVRPGGCVAVVVPALPFIFGALDRAMGHCRRYYARGLSRLFRESGLEVQRARYFNFVGVFGWWLEGCLLRRERIPERQTRFFDTMVPYLAAFERLVPPPLGQSLVVIGRRL